MSYGLEAVDNLTTAEATGTPVPLKIEDLEIPKTHVCEKAYEHVKNQLPQEIINHSLRVYSFGMAILKQQNYHVDEETFYLTALFHDIAANPKNIHGTKLSFEFYGGILARDWLLDVGVHPDRVDSICEAIFRHTLFVGGKINANGQLLQLATLMDVLGLHQNLVHAETIETVIREYPRLKWNIYFSTAMKDEMQAKPGCLTTIGGQKFISNIKTNPISEKYDKNGKL